MTGSGPLHKALVVAPAWIGDAVMAQPLLMRLVEANPTLEIDALASPWIIPVLQRMPQISQVVENPFGHGELELAKRFRFARSLSHKGYQRAYILPNSFKSALIPWFAGVPERIGFTGEARHGIVNRRHHLDKLALPLMVERFAQLAEMPGSALKRPLPFPSLESTTKQHALTLAELNLCQPEKLVIFCPGAEYGPAKRWPAAHFARLASLFSQAGVTVWLLGSGKDKQIGEEIVRLATASSTLNLCGRTTLAQAIDLIALADHVVCNDSGLMHIASALRRPLIAIYGSSSPNFTPPLTKYAKIIQSNISCSPCFKRDCPFGHTNCLKNITPDEVFEACQRP